MKKKCVRAKEKPKDKGQHSVLLSEALTGHREGEEVDLFPSRQSQEHTVRSSATVRQGHVSATSILTLAIGAAGVRFIGVCSMACI